ncbi:MAG: hypothetical protein IJX80_05870 [Clostridia bacterium]|nr:hypothetical protein [Clostridia bacterium]
MMKAKHSAHPHTKAKRDDTPASAALFVRRAAMSLSFTLGLSAVLLIVLSLAAYLTPDPDALTAPLGLAACALTSLFGGMISVRVHQRHAPLPAAFCNAALLSTMMLILSLFFSPLASGYSALISALLHAAVFALSLLGALIAMREPKPKRKRKF